MGLLSRTLDRTAFLLEETGEALQARIEKLTPKNTTPYTALGLLKAYGSFEWGICLSLKNGAYTSYTSIGLGIGQTSIPQEKIWAPEKAREKFIKLENRKSLDIKNTEEVPDYWLFPLVKPASDSAEKDSERSSFEEPWRGVMILGVSDPSFDPEPVSAFVSGVIDKFFIQTEQNDPELLPDTIRESIAEYHSTYTEFNCIILEFSGSPGKKKLVTFCKKVTKTMDKAGKVIPLSNGRLLVLLPMRMDRELIAHRLSKSLNAAAVLSFGANSPDEAISRINAQP